MPIRRLRFLVPAVALAVAVLLGGAVHSRSSVDTMPVKSFPAATGAISLTFDDGPDPRFTPQILEILAEYDAHATFFVVGEAAVREPQLVEAIIAQGHEVAHHTHSHPHVQSADLGRLEYEFDECLEVLEGHDVHVRWYRPPRKGYTRLQGELAASRGMRTALWTRAVERARFSSAHETAEVLLDETEAGDIVLAHDGGGDRSMTVAALPAYLAGLQAQGIDVVTLSRLEEIAAEE